MQTFKELFKLLIWEIVNPAILRCHRKKLYEWDASFKGLNLGCGVDVLPDWIGIDGGVYILYRKLPSFVLRLIFPLLNMSEVYNYDEYLKKLKSGKILHHDLRNNIPYKADSIPYIYSSHFFEHLTKEDALSSLGECFRVLKPWGGVMRIAVPSLDREVNSIRLAIKEYDRGEIEPVSKYLMTKPGFISQFSVHKYMYNFVEMKKLLETAGFVEVTEYTYKTGNIVDVESLDTRQDSLFVEAVKRDKR